MQQKNQKQLRRNWVIFQMVQSYFSREYLPIDCRGRSWQRSNTERHWTWEPVFLPGGDSWPITKKQSNSKPSLFVLLKSWTKQKKKASRSGKKMPLKLINILTSELELQIRMEDTQLGLNGLLLI